MNYNNKISTYYFGLSSCQFHKFIRNLSSSHLPSFVISVDGNVIFFQEHIHVQT